MQEKNKLNLNERPLGKKVNLKIEPCDMGTFFIEINSIFLPYLNLPVQMIMLIQKTTRHSSDLYALVYFV